MLDIRNSLVPLLYTTLLLELTATLLERAEQNERLRIPVVFNLSSWAEKRQPLYVWLAEELSIKYQVPRNLGRSWIENDQLLLLLDGLDEVLPAYRSSCIQALTLYRREHTLVPVVLCSRKAEYEAQSTRVTLSKAVVIQPLTSQQIDDYLTQAGQQLEAVRSLLHEDQELQELARTPLMLTILALTYQGKAVDDLTTRMPSDVRHVLGTYVERMLARRAVSHYAPDQTKSRLVWLARQMVRHSQSVFYLEQMQPDWLDDDQSRQIYQRGVLILYGTLLGGIVGLLASSSVFSTPYAYFMGTLFFALAGTILAKQREATASAERGKYRGYILSGILLGLGGVLSSLVTLLIARVSHGPWQGVSPVWEGLNFALGGLFLNILLTGNFQSYPLTRWVARWGRNLWRRFSSLGSFLPKGQFAGFISEWGKSLQQSFRTFLQQNRWTRRIFLLWRAVQQRYLTREHIKHGLMMGLSITVVAMLHEVLRFDGRPLPKIVGEGIRYGSILGFAGIFLSALLEGLWSGRQKIHFLDIVVWSWKRCKRHLLDLNHIALGFLLALSVGLIVRLSYELRGDVPGPSYGVNFACLIFLNYWLLLGLFRGMARKRLPKQRRARPNQGFWESARNSGLVGGISALVGGLSYSLTVVLRVGVGNGWLTAVTGSGLAFSLAVGLLSGLLIGGKACLQQLLMRWLLWRKGSLPWNYPRFLDYATERILLRKVGGGYIFVHQFLLDHFASLHATSLAPQAAGGSGHVEACVCGCPYRPEAQFCTDCGQPRRETSTE